VQRQAAGLAAAGAVLVGQALVDWIWRIPGLTSLGLFALAAAAALVARSSLPPQRSARWRPRCGARWPAAWGCSRSHRSRFTSADHYIRSARSATTAQARLDRADTAATFAPLSVTPLYLQASALEGEGNRAAARSKLDKALAREPDSASDARPDRRPRGPRRQLSPSPSSSTAVPLALNPLDIGLQKLARSGGRPGA